MEKLGTLQVTADGWRLELADGKAATIDAKVRKEARKKLGLEDADAGAELKAQVQKRPGVGIAVQRIVEVVTPSPRLAEQEERAAAEAARVAEFEAAAARRAEAEAAAEQARYRRAGAGKDVEELSRIYRQHHTTRPDVNAYTFLPYATNPPQDRFEPPRHRTDPKLGIDGTPDAADKLFSGALELELHIRTPLCILGETTPTPAIHKITDQCVEPAKLDDKKPHNHITPLLDSERRPTIPGASIKGAARSWFEAITSSERRSSDVAVAWRSSGHQRGRQLAVLHLHDADDNPVERLETQQSDDSRPTPLLTDITCSLEPVPLWEPQLDDDVHTRFDRTIDNFNLHGCELRDGMEVQGKDGTKGRLKIGISAQEDVSIHVARTHHRNEPYRVATEVLETWWAAHRGSKDPEKKQKSTVQQGGIRLHRIGDPWVLRHGDLVWYEKDRDTGEIVYLGRIRNGRWASLRPLEGKVPTDHTITEADRSQSPADRVFGHAEDGDLLAGRVRFAQATSERADLPTGEYTLRALSSPKLSSAGLYLDGATGPNPATAVTWTASHDGDTWLRGTKVYWHTVPAQVDGLANDARVALEQLASDGRPARTSQNVTVEALRQGTFRTQIQFEDLTRVELGALLLAITLRFDDVDRQVGWKLGIGRPVGLGSLENRLISFRLRDESWLEDPTTSGWRDAIQEVDGLLREAREFYLPNEHDRKAFAFIADHFSLVDRTVGYPGHTELKLQPGGLSKRQPTVEEVSRGASMRW